MVVRFHIVQMRDCNRILDKKINLLDGQNY